MRVLLAGFGRFPGAPFNPSAALAQTLARRRRPALAGLVRHTHIFATSYAAVDRDLPKLFADKPNIVLVFGLAARRPQICVETRARNAVSVLFPDASGYRPTDAAIATGGPYARYGRAPFPRLVGAVRAAKLPARASRDAGRYLCNYVYWRALEHANEVGLLVQFIHIPSISRNPRPRRRPRRRSKYPPPSLGALVAAAERLLIALVAASRR
jgi:pyroglutamyl-peptidase